MESPDLEYLLGVLKSMDNELDKYVSRASEPFEAAAIILVQCKQLRAREVAGPIHSLLGAIERHAQQMRNSKKHAETEARYRTSDAYWSVRLRYDIHAIRAQLTSTQHVVH